MHVFSRNKTSILFIACTLAAIGAFASTASGAEPVTTSDTVSTENTDPNTVPLTGGEDPIPGESGEPSTREVMQQYLLTDEEITALCADAIATNYDMVTGIDPNTGMGYSIPRCVRTYEEMRSVAQRYMAEEEAGVAQIQSLATPPGCNENPTQIGCLEAGKAVTDTAVQVHQNLEAIAAEGADAMAGLAP